MSERYANSCYPLTDSKGIVSHLAQTQNQNRYQSPQDWCSGPGWLPHPHRLPALLPACTPGHWFLLSTYQASSHLRPLNLLFPLHHILPQQPHDWFLPIIKISAQILLLRVILLRKKSPNNSINSTLVPYSHYLNTIFL